MSRLGNIGGVYPSYNRLVAEGFKSWGGREITHEAWNNLLKPEFKNMGSKVRTGLGSRSMHGLLSPAGRRQLMSGARTAGYGMAALGGIRTYNNIRDRRYGSALMSGGFGAAGLYLATKNGQKMASRGLTKGLGSIMNMAAKRI